MERIIIDTNILYSLVGLYENEKVNNSTIKNNELSVTTSSIAEVIVKHHDSLESIKKCIAPIINQEYELINIGYAPIENEYFYRINNASHINEVTDIIDVIKKQKIQIEAEFLRFILIIVISGMYEVIREEGYKFNDTNNDQAQLRLVQSLLESNSDLILNYFKNKISNGYIIGKVQQETKQAFQEMISVLLEVFNINYHMVKVGSIYNSQDDDSIARLTNSIATDDFKSKINKYSENPVSYISKKKNNTILKNFINSMKVGLSDSDKLNEYSLEYILKKIENAFVCGSKIQKNDIFDSLITISLALTDKKTKIATLDKDFIKYLEHVDNDSYQLCKSLNFIN